MNDSSAWMSLSSTGYCFYNCTTNQDTIQKFGALYNWYVVDTKKLSPKGWHIPSDAEWDTLQNYLIANGYNWDATTDSNKIAKSLASKTGWNWWIDNPIGSVGNDTSKNNKSGFTAIPGGNRLKDGQVFGMGYYCFFWSSTEITDEYGFNCSLEIYNADLLRSISSKRCGFSVRLVRD